MPPFTCRGLCSLKADLDTVVSVVDMKQLVKEENQLSTSLTKTKASCETTRFYDHFKEFFDTAHTVYDTFHDECVISHSIRIFSSSLCVNTALLLGAHPPSRQPCLPVLPPAYPHIRPLTRLVGCLRYTHAPSVEGTRSCTRSSR